VLVNNEKQIPSLSERVQTEQSWGLDITLVRNSDLHDLIPGLPPGMLAGSYCPTDGHANPMRTVNAFITAAQRLGARLKWDCAAKGLVVENNRLMAVKTARGELACRHAILAAGYWSRAVAASAGIELPFQSHPLQMMVTARRPHELNQVLAWTGHGISLKQMPTGGFVIGGGWPGHGNPATYQTRLMPGSMAKSARTAVNLYPLLGGLPILRAWLGIEAFCEDEMQVVSPVPVVDGLIIAAGFSGHGFAIGPGVGSLIAEYLRSERWSEMLGPFNIERFENVNKEKNDGR
jgi:sarcosine oxidase subunit beta